MHTLTHVHTHSTLTRTHTHTHSHAHSTLTHTHIHTLTHTHTCALTHMHTHTHTHTHTLTQSSPASPQHPHPGWPRLYPANAHTLTHTYTYTHTHSSCLPALHGRGSGLLPTRPLLPHPGDLAPTGPPALPSWLGPAIIVRVPTAPGSPLGPRGVSCSLGSSLGSGPGPGGTRSGQKALRILTTLNSMCCGPEKEGVCL